MDEDTTPSPTQANGLSYAKSPRTRPPRVPKPPPPPPPKTPFTYVATEDALAEAVAVLSHERALVLDCEGRDLGMPGGAPSLLSLGDLHAEHVYLLDLLALRQRGHAAFAALYELLVNTRVTKVVWDGRADMLELRDELGLDVGPVLDLQIVEAVAPYASRTPAAERRRRKALASGYLRRIKDQIEAAPERFDGVYAIKGLDHCLQWHRVCKTGKDPAVVALHEQADEDSAKAQLWMQRPLPDVLLEYAARDVELIGRVFTAFETRGFLKKKRMPSLMAQSERYVRMWETPEDNAWQTQLHLYSFVPLNVMDPPEPGEETFECETCHMHIKPAGFDTREGDGGFPRSSSCRLCVIVKLREDSTVANERVTSL